MQPKINAFFKRQAPEPGPDSGATEEAKRPRSRGGGADAKVLNKKRSYGQFHLELGQPDFLLHMCAVCGMMYARGNDEDEKVHGAYHKSYFQGVPFKGWCDENVVARSEGGDRIVLATCENSFTRNSKVQEVIKVVEKELGFGEGQLLHKLCKVYLFVSGGRIVGCLVAEPIKAAHRVIPSPSSENRSDLLDNKTESAQVNHTLEFGKISFKREVLRRHNHPGKNKEESQGPGDNLRRRSCPCCLRIPGHLGGSIAQKKRNRVAAHGCRKEELLRRQHVGDLTMRFHTPNICWEGAGVELLQDERILSLQGGRCIRGDAPIYG